MAWHAAVIIVLPYIQAKLGRFAHAVTATASQEEKKFHQETGKHFKPGKSTAGMDANEYAYKIWHKMDNLIILPHDRPQMSSEMHFLRLPP